jgi:hypothetical protein
MCLPVNPFKIEKEWKHAGLKCAVVQAREASHRCGNVRVPPGHRMYGKPYDETAELEVHGGITFSEQEPCTEEDGKGWWFGFDFCHLQDAMFDPDPDYATLSEEAKTVLETMGRIRGDVSLKVYGKLTSRHEHFWTLAEVERECEWLAEQLAAPSHDEVAEL